MVYMYPSLHVDPGGVALFPTHKTHSNTVSDWKKNVFTQQVTVMPYRNLGNFSVKIISVFIVQGV
jgi:hypothetical protein